MTGFLRRELKLTATTTACKPINRLEKAVVNRLIGFF